MVSKCSHRIALLYLTLLVNSLGKQQNKFIKHFDPTVEEDYQEQCKAMITDVLSKESAATTNSVCNTLVG